MSTELNGREKGQLLLIVALAIVVLVGSLALAIDGSNIYAQRRLMQNAADAGALAGARALAVGEDPNAVVEAATEYTVDRNGADSAEITIDDEAQIVTVVARKSFPTFFACVIDWPTLHVGARANAGYAPVSAISGGLFPIAVYTDTFTFGVEYEILAGGGPGNFGWLAWAGCTSAVCLCESLTPPEGISLGGNSETYVNPYDPDDDDGLSIGDWVWGSTGIQPSNCVEDYLDKLIDWPDPIIVVLWDEAQEQGANLTYHVVGFAAFKLTRYKLAGKNEIWGVFDRMVNAGTGVTPGPGQGVYRVMLIE